MPFNSLSFIVFFVLFTAVYFFVDAKKRLLVLLMGSWLFYFYANAFNLIYLIVTTLITYFFASKIKTEAKNKRFLITGIFLILLELIFAKYTLAFTNQLPVNISSQDKFFNFFIFPIGISFYSLQAISLLVDIRSKKYQDELRFKDVSLFLSFFPQSISGPIHRSNELIPQFSNPKVFVSENIIIGFKTMLWGYFCKLVIADKIALIITPIFNSYLEKDGLSISIAALLYSFQVYFDFWGYSLVAIGVGRILGFTININFANPYSAKSFKDFWHKWHITLSKWMRDYIYIPMGGNKKNYSIFCLSILVTFLVSGFWHGATFNFILWGATHAFLYLSEDLITRFFSLNSSKPLSKFIKPFWTILFFILISLTWLIFRTDNISDLIAILKSIISLSDWTTANTINHYFSTINILYLLIILTTIIFAQTKMIDRLIDTVPVSGKEIIVNSIFVCICIVAIILWGDIGGQEFLYFRF